MIADCIVLYEFTRVDAPPLLYTTEPEPVTRWGRTFTPLPGLSSTPCDANLRITVTAPRGTFDPDIERVTIYRVRRDGGEAILAWDGPTAWVGIEPRGDGYVDAIGVDSRRARTVAG